MWQSFFNNFHLAPCMLQVSLPDSVLNQFDDSSRQVLDSLLHSLGEAKPGTGAPHYLLPPWMLTLLVLAVLLAGLVYAIGPPIFGRRIADKMRWGRAQKEIDQKEALYQNWLMRYNPYYASLTPSLQKRFLFRSVAFMQSKLFIYHDQPAEEQIPLLISAAAVQVTFGLRNYLMDYFSEIHVMGNQYTINNNDADVYYGHVSHTGIHVAWNYFVKGFSNYSDGTNVGLHEMAHAISYDVFLGQADRFDRAMKQKLQDFTQENRPAFRSLKKGMSHTLNDYAGTNFDEFWAVCIETFFENPDSFRATDPDLYFSICDTLNQDPLRPQKIIDADIAGLDVEVA